MADREIEKVSESGITIEGVPLEEYVKDEEAREVRKEAFGEKHFLYHGVKVKAPVRESAVFKDGIVRFLTRREINKERWEELLMDTKSVDKAIITILLSGTAVSSRLLKAKIVDTLKVTGKTYDIRMSHLLHRTDFGKLVKIERKGTVRTYSLVSAALDCSADELHVFVYRSKEVEPVRNQVLEVHPGLRPYIEKERPSVGQRYRKQFTPEQDRAKLTDKVFAGMEKMQDTAKILTSPIKRKIEEVASSTLGIKVEVSGSIEVIFKIG